MKVLTDIEVFCELCKNSKKWGMFFYFDSADSQDLLLVLNLMDLSFEDHAQVITDGRGFILFNSEKELYDCYNRVAQYESEIYAMTCNSDGIIETENT